MKKSTLYSFSRCAFIAAFGSLMIFAHPSVAKAGKLPTLFSGGLKFGIARGRQLVSVQGARQLKDDVYIGALSRRRRAEATGGDEDASTSNKFHINLKELSSLNCADGCTATFALIKSDQCNSANAHGSALEFPLEEEVSFDNTDIKDDEDAPDNGWVTDSFRVLKKEDAPMMLILMLHLLHQSPWPNSSPLPPWLLSSSIL
jgi:hypothetical protein